jgi:ParB-like chromosome segregation protein Spo0J
MKEPLKYVEINGEKCVVDGNHRLRAARSLGLNDVPAQKVNLPFKGYQNENDVLTGGD